jgi:hypothetical protein
MKGDQQENIFDEFLFKLESKIIKAESKIKSTLALSEREIILKIRPVLPKS